MSVTLIKSEHRNLLCESGSFISSWRRPILLLCAALATGLMSLPTFAAPARWFSYDPARLAAAHEKIASGDPLYKPSYDALLKEADAALASKPSSVTEKGLAPASGDKHDYFSFGPYWWPNPDTPNSLPYIRKDGQTNPASKTGDTDSKRLAEFAGAISSLALAYNFTGDQKYAAHAAEMLRVWFVAPKTRMNPNMTYAQAIPGIVDGRGIGIIDSRLFIDVMDAVELIRPADKLSETDYQTIRAWYRDLNEWLLTSSHGFEESNWHNNHGTWYDAQVVAFSLFTDQPDLAKRQLKITALRRVAGQFDKEGRQVAELERTRPWHYSQFNLQAYGKLGRYAELVDAGLRNDLDPTDLWSFTLDSHTLKKGYSFIAGFVTEADKTNAKWPYKELEENDGMELAVGNMLIGAHVYKDPQIKQAAALLLARYPGQIEALLQPLD